MGLKIDAGAWRALWIWSLRPTLAVSVVLNAAAIYEALRGHGPRSVDYYYLVTVPLIFGALGLGLWLLRMAFDLLKLGAMLAIGFVITQFLKISSNRKATTCEARLQTEYPLIGNSTTRS